MSRRREKKPRIEEQSERDLNYKRVGWRGSSKLEREILRFWWGDCTLATLKSLAAQGRYNHFGRGYLTTGPLDPLKWQWHQPFGRCLGSA